MTATATAATAFGVDSDARGLPQCIGSLPESYNR